MKELLVGTKKGLFVLRGDGPDAFEIATRAFAGNVVEYAMRDPRSGRYFASVTSGFYGPRLMWTDDPAGEWEHARDARDAGRHRRHARTDLGRAHRRGARTSCGPASHPAALFESRDGGRTWELNRGLWDQPSRPDWNPGNGGLCLHSISHVAGRPANACRSGSARVGTWHTDRRRRDLDPRDEGSAPAIRARGSRRTPRCALCVHNLWRRTHDARAPVHAVPWWRLPQRRRRRTPGSTSPSRPAERLRVPDRRRPGRPRQRVRDPDERRRRPGDGRRQARASTRRATRAPRGSARGDGPAGPGAAYLTILREAFDRDGEGDAMGLWFGATSGEVFGSMDAGDVLVHRRASVSTCDQRARSLSGWMNPQAPIERAVSDPTATVGVMGEVISLADYREDAARPRQLLRRLDARRQPARPAGQGARVGDVAHGRARAPRDRGRRERRTSAAGGAACRAAGRAPAAPRLRADALRGRAATSAVDSRADGRPASPCAHPWHRHLPRGRRSSARSSSPRSAGATAPRRPPPHPHDRRPRPSVAPPAPQAWLTWVPGGLPASYGDLVSTVPDVVASTTATADIAWMTASLDADGNGVDEPQPPMMIPMEVTGVDPTFAAFIPEPERQLVQNLRPGEGILSESEANLRGSAPGATLLFRGGEQIDVIGTLPDALMGDYEVLVTRETGRQTRRHPRAVRVVPRAAGRPISRQPTSSPRSATCSRPTRRIRPSRSGHPGKPRTCGRTIGRSRRSRLKLKFGEFTARPDATDPTQSRDRPHLDQRQHPVGDAAAARHRHVSYEDAVPAEARDARAGRRGRRRRDHRRRRVLRPGRVAGRPERTAHRGRLGRLDPAQPRGERAGRRADPVEGPRARAVSVGIRVGRQRRVPAGRAVPVPEAADGRRTDPDRRARGAGIKRCPHVSLEPGSSAPGPGTCLPRHDSRVGSAPLAGAFRHPTRRYTRSRAGATPNQATRAPSRAHEARPTPDARHRQRRRRRPRRPRRAWAAPPPRAANAAAPGCRSPGSPTRVPPRHAADPCPG